MEKQEVREFTDAVVGWVKKVTISKEPLILPGEPLNISS